MNNRRHEKLPSFVGWIGNMATPRSFLASKEWASAWLPLKAANSFFRALGVVAFACNPLTGILIFSGMLLGNYEVAIGALVGGVVAIIAAKILNVPDEELNDGVPIFNSILVGGVMTAILPPKLGFVPIDIGYCAVIIVASFVTVYVDQGLNVLLSLPKLPGQSVPFNFVSTFLFIIYSRYNGMYTEDADEIDTIAHQELANETISVDWIKVLEGSALATGQIYGVGTMTPSICIWLGFFLFSPLLTLMFFVGALIGAVSGTLFNMEPLALSEVYSGLWSYNTLLAAGGMTFFVVPTPSGLLSGVVNALIAVCVHNALIPAFSQTNLPVLSYPFNVAIMLVLAIAMRKKPPLMFVTQRSFPELHIYLYRKDMLRHSHDDLAEISLKPSEKW